MLAYPTAAGFNYLLQRTSSLQSGVWLDSDARVSGDGAWRRPLVPISADNVFYRLQIAPGR